MALSALALFSSSCSLVNDVEFRSGARDGGGTDAAGPDAGPHVDAGSDAGPSTDSGPKPDVDAGDGGGPSSEGGTPECGQGKACQTPKICVAERCVYECEDSGDCTDNGMCVGKRCVLQCKTAGDCQFTYRCVDHLCRPPLRQTAVWATAGGAVRESANYRVRLSVGAPQPFGTVESNAGDYRVRLGAALIPTP